LKKPQFWLVFFGLLTLLVFSDTCRAPARQISVRIYCVLVDGYRWTKTELHLHPRCRFVPSCSQYSQEAVRRFGFWKGIKLTYLRLDRCRPSVPEGTYDPVPAVLANGIGN
jgi:putative membrane protein insertion efficiency factor